jgi:chromosomal replication initiation ATPase DnaA
VEFPVFEQEAFLTKNVARDQQMSIGRVLSRRDHVSIATAVST